MTTDSPDESLESSSDKTRQQSIHIDVTPEFRRNLRSLKRYRSIREDVQVVVDELQAGNFVGDRLTGVGEGYVVFKVRVRNRDIQKGKSGSYRLIYQLETSTSILLLTIYPKSEREDIKAKEVREILKEFYEE